MQLKLLSHAYKITTQDQSKGLIQKKFHVQPSCCYGTKWVPVQVEVPNVGFFCVCMGAPLQLWLKNHIISKFKVKSCALQSILETRRVVFVFLMAR